MKQTIHVTGMHCHGCEKNATMCIEEIDGIKVLEASHEKNEITVELNDISQRPSVISAIKEAGYSAD